MKQKIPIYVYKNQEYIGKFNSMVEAANYCKLVPTQISKIAKGKQKCTKDGFYFSFNKLTEDEKSKLPIKTNKKQEYIINEERSCKQKAFKRVYEVSCANPQIMLLPSNKQERIEQFKTFLYKNLRDRWMYLPQNVVSLQKVYINEFLKSFE